VGDQAALGGHVAVVGLTGLQENPISARFDDEVVDHRVALADHADAVAAAVQDVAVHAHVVAAAEGEGGVGAVGGQVVAV